MVVLVSGLLWATGCRPGVIVADMEDPTDAGTSLDGGLLPDGGETDAGMDGGANPNDVDSGSPLPSDGDGGSDADGGSDGGSGGGTSPDGGPFTCGDKTCNGDQKCLTCNGKYHCGALDEEACCVGNQVTYNDVDVYKPATTLCCPMSDSNGNNLLCDNSTDECMAKVGGTHQQCVKIGSTACSATAICDPGHPCLTCGSKSVCGNPGEVACCNGTPWSSLGVDTINASTKTCCPYPNSSGLSLWCDNAIEQCMSPAGANYSECHASGSSYCGDSICAPSENCYTCAGATSVCGPQNHTACCNELGTVYVIDPFLSVCCPEPNIDGSALACSLPASCVQATTTSDPEDYTCSAFP